MIRNWNRVHEIASKFILNYSNHNWKDISGPTSYYIRFYKVCDSCGLIAKHSLSKESYKTLRDHSWQFYIDDVHCGSLYISNNLSLSCKFPVSCSDFYEIKMQEALE